MHQQIKDKIQRFVEAQRLPAKTLYQYKLYHLKYIAWYREVYNAREEGNHSSTASTSNVVDYASVDIDAYKICLFLIHFITNIPGGVDSSEEGDVTGEAPLTEKASTAEKVVPALEFLYKLATLATADHDTVAHTLVARSIPNNAVIVSFVSYLRLIDAISMQRNNDNNNNNNNKQQQNSVFKTSLDKLKLVVDFQLQYYGNIPYNKRELIKISDMRVVVDYTRDLLPGFGDLIVDIQLNDSIKKSNTVILPSVPTNVFICGMSTMSCFMFLKVYGGSNYQGDLKGMSKAYTNGAATSEANELGAKDKDTAKEDSNTKSLIPQSICSRLPLPLIKGRFLNKCISRETMSQYYQTAFSYLKEPYKKNNFFDKKLSAAATSTAAPKIVFNGFGDLKPVPMQTKSSSPSPHGAVHHHATKTKIDLITARFWDVQPFEQSTLNTNNQDMAQIIQYVTKECRSRTSTREELKFVDSIWQEIPQELHVHLFAEFKEIANDNNDTAEFQFWETMGKHVLWILPFLYKFFPNFDIFLSSNGLFIRQQYVQYYLSVWNRYATDPVGQQIWNRYVAMLDSLVENHMSAGELLAGMNASWEGPQGSTPSLSGTASTGMSKHEVEKFVESLLSKQKLQSDITVKKENTEDSLNGGDLGSLRSDEEEENEEDDEQQLQQLIKLLISKEFSVLKNELKKELHEEIVAELRSCVPEEGNTNKETTISSTLLSNLKKELLADVKASVITQIKNQVAQDITTGFAQNLKRDIKYELNRELEEFLRPSSTTAKQAKPIANKTDHEQLPNRVSSLPAKRTSSSEQDHDDQKLINKQPSPSKLYFTLNPNEQLPIADIICEWYSPDPQQHNMSISSMNKKYNTVWRATNPNKHLYKLRKPVIEAYLKTFSALQQRAKGSKNEVDLKLEALQLLESFCTKKFAGNMVELSLYVKTFLKNSKSSSGETLPWM
ncbi:hypothetical protein ACO0QE_001541 [Hanseniaspora vineae]